MTTILVTTPKSRMKEAAQEAKDCTEHEMGGSYFRRFATKPAKLEPDMRIFYTEDGFIRGFAIVSEVMENSSGLKCDTTGLRWPPGFYAIMSACSWTWIKPIPYKGFQGFRYFDDSEIEFAGYWLDPKPEV